MKRSFFFFITLILSNTGFAQVNLDSLWNVWSDETQVDTIRMRAIHTFIHGGENREFTAQPLFYQNPDSLCVLSELVSDMANSGRNKKYQLLAVRLKGMCNQAQRNHPEALRFYAEAVEMAKEMQDGRLILLSFLTLANAENALGSPRPHPDTILLAQAEEHYLEALNLFELRSFSVSEEFGHLDPQLLSYETLAIFGLGQANVYQENYPMARKYFEQAIELAWQSGDHNMLETAMTWLAWVLGEERNYQAAIKYFTKSLQSSEENGNKHWRAHNLQFLGELYTEVGEYSKAEDYLTRALTSMQEAGALHSSDQVSIVELLSMCYRNQKNYSKALEYDSMMLKLAEEFYPASIPRAMQHFAYDFFEMGDYTKALEYSFKALRLNEDYESDMTDNIRNTLYILIGKTYSKQGLFAKAITWCKKTDADLPLQDEKDVCECLYEAHKGLKQGSEALVYLEKFQELSDSLNTEELVRNLQQMEFAQQLMEDSLVQVEETRLVEAAHQEEVRSKEKQRNILLGSGLFVLMFAGGLWSRLRYIRKSKDTLQVEKDRSENLLLNILPVEVAEELKANGRAQARDFERVSILFTDFKEFTETSEKLSAAELVDEINYCFEGFDTIMDKYGVEKIKTIGDAYMAAGGLPVSGPDSTKNTVKAALEMCELIKKRKTERESEGKIGFEMRCGIHSGPVVAGIVGVKKFQYDIWGDTVNTASRMESLGEVGLVNISHDTYKLIKDEGSFSFEKRGKIEVKGKGELDMYFVDRDKK